MRPILVAIPSKWLFVVALILGIASLVRDLWRRHKDPKLPLSSTPLYLLGGAVALMYARGGGLIPTKELFAAPWKDVPIYAYGVMLGTSMIVGWFLAMRLAKDDGIHQETAGAIYMWTAVWSIIGARLLWGITNPSELFPPNGNFMRLFKVWEGGLVAYGGMIGGFLASWYNCHKRNIPLLRWADVSAPSVVLGTAITRVGCLLFGCDYGRPAEGLAWAIRFPQHPAWGANPSPAWQRHVKDYHLPTDALYSLPVHPTQIYELLAGLFIFGLCMYMRKVRKFSGQVFVTWVLGYGVLRSIIELYRDDDDRGVYGGISTSQWIGMASAVLAIVLLVKLYQKYRQDPASLRLWEQPLDAVPAEAAAPAARQRKRRKAR
jgi:phosphatidylglycerol:prolipoprotein diacylglycerol transferase